MSDKQELTKEEKENAVRVLMKSPTIFCKEVIGLNPFPYQEKLLEDKSKKIVVCAGRQVGKSLITAARSLWFSIMHHGKTTLIVSATQRQSSLMFDKILKYVEGSSLLTKSITRKTRTLVRFTNKSEIIALPCGFDGNSLRGHSAHMIVFDEAAFIPENVITDVAMPMLSTTNGTAIMLSTPYGRDHYFFKAFTSPLWSKYQFKTSDNPLVSKEFLDQQLEEIGQTRFRQEYLAEFVDEVTTYFPTSLLRSSVHKCTGESLCSYCEMCMGRKSPSGELYAGYDPGGVSDPAALVVVQRYRDTIRKALSYRVVLTKTFLREKQTKDTSNVYTQFTAAVADIHRELHFSRLLVDSTGLGSPIVEHCRSLNLPVEGMMLTQKTKEEVLSNLKITLEQGRMMLPENLELLSSLNCIEAERTRSGGYTFDHARGTHDDLGYALALAMWSARNTPSLLMMRYDEPKKPESWREKMGFSST